MATGSAYESRTLNSGQKKKGLKRNFGRASQGSDMYFGGQDPVRLKKKQRPFSAPRHQGLRSLGLKNKI